MDHKEQWIEGNKKSERYVQDLRKHATVAERCMAQLLDAAKISYVFQSKMFDWTNGRIYIADFRIRRQHVGRPKGMPRKEWRDNGQHELQKLFVEVDGGYHQDRRAYDERRTRWMQAHRNAIVLRFTNEDVMQRGADVIAKIETFGPTKRPVHVSKTSPFRKRTRKTNGT